MRSLRPRTRGPAARPTPPGFTVAELLIAIACLGALAALVVAKFADAKEKAYVDAQMNDLRNYAIAQELAHDRAASYADTAQMRTAHGFKWSPDVQPDSQDLASPGRWHLRTRHAKTRIRCWLTITAEQDPTAQKIQCGPGGAAAPAGPQLTADFWAQVRGANVPRPATLPATYTFHPAEEIVFDGTPSLAAGAPIGRYLWTFGDGQSGLGAQPTHTYAAPGRYAVQLTVVDSAGRTASVTKALEMLNLPPVATLNVQDDRGNVAARPVATLGTVAAAKVGVAPGATGRVAPQVSAQVKAVQVQAATPTLDGLTPGTYLFDGSGSYDPDGRIVATEWFFTDWQTATGPQIWTQLRANDSVDVILTVVDNFGASDQTTVTLRTADDPTIVQPAFTWTPQPAVAARTTEFDASATTVTPSQAAEYLWDLGDWREAVGRTPRVVFPAAGTYPVTLRVLARSGVEGALTRTVTVIDNVTIPTAGLRYFWDMCASFGTQTLVNKSALGAAGNGYLGASPSADAADLGWAIAPVGRDGQILPPSLMQHHQGSKTTYAQVPNFSSAGAKNHTFVYTYAAVTQSFAASIFNYSGNATIEHGRSGDRFAWNTVILTPAAADADSVLGRPDTYYDGRYHAFAWVFDSTAAQVRLYADGRHVASGPYSPTAFAPVTATFFRHGNSLSTRFFTGMAYYTKALTAAEVTDAGTAMLEAPCASPRLPKQMAIVPDSLLLQPQVTGDLRAVVTAETPADTIPAAVQWQSLDPEVATVSATGRVTALRVGRARIMATLDNLSDVATVVVQATAVPAGATNRWTACQSFGSQTLRDEIGTAHAVLGASTAAEGADPTWTSPTALDDGLTGPPGLVTPMSSNPRYATLPTFESRGLDHTFSFLISTPTLLYSSSAILFKHQNLVLALTYNGSIHAVPGYNRSVDGPLYTPVAGRSLASTQLTDGRLHTLTYTFAGGKDSAAIYVDGVRVAHRAYTRDFQLLAATTTVLFNDQNYPFAGNFYGMTYFPRALSDAEAAQFDQAQRALACPPIAAPADARVQVTPDTLDVQVATAARLTARVTRADTLVPGAAVTWSSGDPAIASVDSTGRVTGVAGGGVWVRASIGTGVGQSDSSWIVVRPRALPGGAYAVWAPCASYGTQTLTDVGTMGAHGTLGLTSGADAAEDPVWASAAPLGPALKITRAYGGADQYVAVPGFSSASANHTFVFTFMTTGARSDGPFFYHPNLSAFYEYGGANFGVNQAQFTPVAGQSVATAAYAHNVVHTAAYRFDAATRVVELWVDGVLRGTRAYTPTTLPAMAQTRLLGFNSSWRPPVNLGTSVYYPRVLSDAEIVQAHNDLVTGRCQIPGVPDLGVDVTPNPATVVVGRTLALTGTVRDEYGTVVTDSTAALVWSVSNPSVATIDAATGVVTGRTVGATQATARVLASGRTATVSVRVTAPSAAALTVSPNPLSVPASGTGTLQATLTDDQGAPVAPSSYFTWRVASGTDKVAIASTNGATATIRGIAAGGAQVTVSYGTLQATATVNVSDLGGQPSGNRRSMVLTVGQSATINGDPAATWTNSAPSIVRLTKPGVYGTTTGTVEGLAVGQSQIVAAGASTDTLDVLVQARSASTACLQVMPKIAVVGQPVTFDPRCSYSANGGFVRQKLTLALREGAAGQLTSSDVAAAGLPEGSMPFGVVTASKGFPVAGDYLYTFEVEEQCDGADWTTTTCVWSLPPTGYDIRYRTNNMTADVGMIRVTVLDAAGSAPVVDITKQDYVNTLSVTSFDELPRRTFTGVGTDANGDLVQLRWSVRRASDPMTTTMTAKTTPVNPAAGSAQDTWPIDLQASGPGTYVVTLEGTDALGRTGRDEMTVVYGASNRPPVAAFNPPGSIVRGTAAIYDASPSYDPDGDTPLRFYWVFEELRGWPSGEYKTASGVQPVVTLTNLGSYNVTMTVYDAKGLQSSITKAVTVADTPTGGTPPQTTIGATQARFAFSPNYAPAGTTVTFDGTGSIAATGATITSYAWDFGDWVVATGARATHAFGNAGSFNAKLTVTDSKGGTSTTTKVVVAGVIVSRIDITASVPALHNCIGTSPTQQVTFTARAYGANGEPVTVPIMWTYTASANGFTLGTATLSPMTWTTPVTRTDGGGTFTVKAAPNLAGAQLAPLGFPAGYNGVTGTLQLPIVGCTPGY